MDIVQLVVAGIVLIAGFLLVERVWRRIRSERWLRIQLAEWSAIAGTLGLRAQRSGDRVTIDGTVAGRSFEVSSGNFITYGMDSELGMRVSVDDPDARMLILDREYSRSDFPAGRKRTFDWYGELRAPTGDPPFDALFDLRANPAGLAYLTRLGPGARSAWLEFPKMRVYLGNGSVFVHFWTYELQAAQILAARQVLADLLGVPDVQSAALR